MAWRGEHTYRRVVVLALLEAALDGHEGPLPVEGRVRLLPGERVGLGGLLVGRGAALEGGPWRRQAAPRATVHLGVDVKRPAQVLLVLENIMN